MDIKDELLLWFTNFLIKSLRVAVSVCQQLMKNQQKNCINQILENFKKRAVYSAFKDNIWGDDLADMQLMNKFNKEFTFLLCVIDIFSKYACVVPLKDKKGITIVNAFKRIY